MSLPKVKIIRARKRKKMILPMPHKPRADTGDEARGSHAAHPRTRLLTIGSVSFLGRVDQVRSDPDLR